MDPQLIDNFARAVEKYIISMVQFENDMGKLVDETRKSRHEIRELLDLFHSAVIVVSLVIMILFVYLCISNEAAPQRRNRVNRGHASSAAAPPSPLVQEPTAPLSGIKEE